MRRSLTLLVTSAAVLVASSAFAAAPYYAVGDHNSWDPPSAPEMKDDGVAPDLVSGDGIYTLKLTIATAGAYGWKVLEDEGPDTDPWNPAWPGSNCWYITTGSNQDVVLTFDTNTQGDGWSPDSFWPRTDATFGTTYGLVGDLQTELGGLTDWDPTGTLYLQDDGLNGDATSGDGIYTFCGNISPANTYSWKIAVNGAWSQQFGDDGPSQNGGNMSVTVTDGEYVCFALNTNTGRIRSGTPAQVPVELSRFVID